MKAIEEHPAIELTPEQFDLTKFNAAVTTHIRPGQVRVWNAYRGTGGKRSMHERFVDLLTRPAHWSARGVRYQIAATCRRCNRALTHPESLDHGYGPTCWEKLIMGGM